MIDLYYHIKLNYDSDFWKSIQNKSNETLTKIREESLINFNEVPNDANIFSRAQYYYDISRECYMAEVKMIDEVKRNITRNKKEMLP